MKAQLIIIAREQPGACGSSCSVADQPGKAPDVAGEMFSKWLKSPSVPKVHVSTLGGPSDPGFSFSMDPVLTLSQFILQ